MSLTTLSKEVRRICGEPRRGRPSKECSEILKILRTTCARKENHTLSKRVCRPKLKRGRKPKPKQPQVTKRQAVPKAKSANMMTIKKYSVGPRSVSRKPMLPLPKARKSSPKPQPVKACSQMRLTADEIRILRNPMANAKQKAKIRAICESQTNTKGRKCALRLRTGVCYALK